MAAGRHHQNVTAGEKRHFGATAVFHLPAGNFATGLDVEHHDEGVALPAFAGLGDNQLSIGRQGGLDEFVRWNLKMTEQFHFWEAEQLEAILVFRFLLMGKSAFDYGNRAESLV